MRQKKKLLFLAALAVLLLLVTIFAKQFCPYDPYEQDLTQALQPPGAAHLMGTDLYGRDMFSRVLIASQTSISSALLLVAVITVTGTLLGILSGYYGGTLDAVIMWFSDLFLAFPGLVFAMAVAAILNGGVRNAVIALALINWPKYARIARSQALTVKKRSYIEAARVAGDTTLQLMFRHILPNIAGQILVTAMLDIGTMMMEIAGLSYLGLGAQPPVAEWGSMMSSGRSMLQTYPWVVLSPGVAIFVSVVVFNLLGDAVRDELDPKNE